ncbi:transcription initiation factor tfiid subunit [Grosmannia clavigera kw1407]|uniref:Transcription initiation factor TFIID subunit 13 n=1 Tax=Grosmannia clavigera (strain kw1407 / UAMH 11150) TaxID=655863 RepID=F0XD49_GROCL|nr:transcription initiation factor tfiid subunit [Grosmannia clavigera kw1407]EFX04150.1 transcription initiation factor tfiid subunit [Grosmannia clavigera kw1407]
MEPRARAGKNVGKMNFGYGELRQLLYGCGDVREPLPDTMRLLDEIATDFIQGLSFEAARVAHYAGRQKIKYEDFEFALRRNPLFLGKVREMFEMSKEVKDARKMPGIGEGNLGKADVNELAKLGGIGEDATREAGVRGATDGDGGGADGQGSTVAVPQKRKYNKTGESKKKKKANVAPASAVGADEGDDLADLDDDIDAELR